eukprot:gene2713-3489_t
MRLCPLGRWVPQRQVSIDSDDKFENSNEYLMRSGFANAVAGERAPLLDLSLNPYEQPACSDNKNVPNKAKKVKTYWVHLASRTSLDTFKEHRAFVKSQAIHMVRLTQSEYSRTYSCLTHQDADGNPCTYAEKYQFNVTSGKWDVFHNGSEHFEVASGKHVGVPLHFRKEISQHAAANRRQPMLALQAVVGDGWDGSEEDRAK